jgi:hypothetical protein
MSLLRGSDTPHRRDASVKNRAIGGRHWLADLLPRSNKSGGLYLTSERGCSMCQHVVEGGLDGAANVLDPLELFEAVDRFPVG